MASPPPGLEALPEQLGAGRDKVVLANHDRANDYVLLTREIAASKGKFEVRVTLPEALPYARLTLRAYAATTADEALGVLTVDVKK